MPSPVLKARSAVGVATRNGDPTKIEDARRELAAANLEAYIQRIVSHAPPLTPEQVDRVAVLLRGGGR